MRTTARPTEFEVPLKQFFADQAQVRHVSKQTVFTWFYRRRDRYFPHLKLRRVNKRVVFVDTRSV